MPTTIPFDSSLVLGQMISVEKVQSLQEIAKAQLPIDLAESSLNAMIQAKLSLQATAYQVSSITSDTTLADQLQEKLTTLDAAIVNAVGELVDAKITAYGADGTIQAASQHASTIVNYSVESPISYDRSPIKTYPLSSNSMKLDSQYFSYDSNTQSADNHISSVKAFVGSTTNILGWERSGQVTATTAEQVASQLEQHDVIGTLVITAVATHEGAKMMDPVTLDADRAIRAWNEVFPDESINNLTLDGITAEFLSAEDDDSSNAVDLLTGMTSGSSFVGMVHVLKTALTDTTQRMDTISASVREHMKTGAWFAKMEGGFGVDATFANDIKELLSTQEISSHCNLICMGCIPSIVSSEVQVAVKTFNDFDPASMMDKLATLANTSKQDDDNLQSAANDARTGKQMTEIRSAEIKSMVASLGEIDDGKNKMLDINTLMTAFEDYVQKASTGDAGVPINFYVSSFKKTDICMAYLTEKYPDDLDDVLNPADVEDLEDEEAGSA